VSPAVFAHGHLRLYLLNVLAERPMHGYEIIQALSDTFGGTYVPSAGTIYPRLSKLEEDGLVTKQSDGRKTVYSITDAGRLELIDRKHELDDIEDGIGDSVRRLANEVRNSVGVAMTSLRADLAAAAREARDDSRAASRGGKARDRDSGDASGSDAPHPTAWPTGPGPGAAGRGAETAGPGAETADPVSGTARDGAGDESAASEPRHPRGALVTHDPSQERLQRAHAALTAFRHDLRAELRSAAARGAVPESAVDRLEQGLTALQDEVRALLG